jgi:uncharacterized membrane protein YeaQ/YmgE (transglycosylase-associated protein family)
LGIEFSDAIYSFVNFFRGYADFVDSDGYLNYKILVLWGLVAFFAVYAVMDIRSARGMLTGFLVSIVGAVFLMMLLTVTTNEMKNELVKLDAIASEGKAAPAAVTYPDAEHAKSHENEIRRKKVALSKSIDLSGILMNFIIMTLGGFGSGVLAAVAVSSSTVFKPYNYKRRAAVQLSDVVFVALGPDLSRLCSFFGICFRLRLFETGSGVLCRFYSQRPGLCCCILQ